MFGGLADIAAAGGTVTNTGSAVTLTLGGAVSSSFTGLISGNLSLSKTGSASQTLGHANTFTGTTTLTAGTLVVGDNAAFSTGNIYLQGATLDLNGKTIDNTVYFTGGNLIGGTLLASQLIVESGNISAVLSGPGRFNKTGTGTLTISGANNFTGGTVVDDGILAMGAHNVLPGTITLNGGVENGRYGGVLAMGAFNNSNSTTIVFNGGDVTSTLGFTGILTGTSFTSTNTILDASEIRAVLAGAGASLTLSGAGTTALYGVNTYTGGTFINNGILLLKDRNRLNAAGIVTVNGGIFDLGGFAQQIGAVTLQTGTIRNGNLSGASYDFQLGTVSAVVADGSGGATAVNKTTAGTVTMTEINSYTGGTNVTAGTLALVQANALFRTGVINVSGGTFDLGGVAQKTGLVTLTGGTIANGTLNASGYTLMNGAISAVIGNVTSPAAATAINKVTDGSGGGGTVVLSNVNTYTGGTNVTGGTLQLTINGALPVGRTLVVNGGTLDLTTTAQSVSTLQITSGSITSSTGTITVTSGGTPTFDLQGGTVSAILAGTGVAATKSGGRDTIFPESGTVQPAGVSSGSSSRCRCTIT
jgi:autotransporter-associated beta strand protein